jgi:hypothetical protein
VFENQKRGITPFLQSDADIVRTAKHMIIELPIQVHNMGKGTLYRKEEIFMGKTEYHHS